MYRFLLLALALVATSLAAAAPHFADDKELIDRVIELVDRRLALMPEVAATKFAQHKPIADPAREQEVIDRSVADAQTLHLEPAATRAFFAMQIRMARAVQEQCFARWQASQIQPPPARDLNKELRPALDTLGRDLLPALYLAASALSQQSARTLQPRLAPLRQYAGITDQHLADLAEALAAFRFTRTPDWAAIQRVGTLRVGTTGDYAPFSDDRNGVLQGLDIELVQDLAKTWGVAVLFVRTTWPTLMDDLRQQRFDLAASGISITDERRRHAAFSTPYFFDGKTPIARREDAARFSSLAAIDQPGVRVIVNPGGTNERFAREQLRRATVVLHPDNRTIFAEIVARRADVMITDGIEVRLQERLHPGLRGTMSEPFTRAGKAVLFPLQSDLTSRTDAWLQPQLERGLIAERLSRALAAHDRSPD